MVQSPEFVARGSTFVQYVNLKAPFIASNNLLNLFDRKVLSFGLIRSQSEYSLFYKYFDRKCIILVVYDDIIVITDDNVVGNDQLKAKNLECLMYFLGISVAQYE